MCNEAENPLKKLICGPYSVHVPNLNFLGQFRTNIKEEKLSFKVENRKQRHIRLLIDLEYWFLDIICNFELSIENYSF